LRGAKRRRNPFFLFAERWIASLSLSSGAHSRDPVARNDGKKLSPRPFAATGRQINSRRSTSVTPMSIRMTKADSTNMPANTPATSNTPSACWIR
jgi:hypothetical protein